MRRQLWEWLQRKSHPREAHDLEDELRTHLDMQAEDNRAIGHDSKEADRLARLKLGPLWGVVERTMEQDASTFFETWYRDIVVGLRSIRKNPVFAVIAVLTIAIGIGANSAVFSLLYGLLLRGLPVPAPQRLARIEIASPKIASEHVGSYLTYGMFKQFRQGQRSFEDIGAWTRGSLTIRDKEGTLRVYYASFSTGNSFAAIGLKPYLGRLLSAADDHAGRPAQGWPAILSHSLWTSQFASDKTIIGRHIEVQNLPAIVAGVAPPGFDGPWPGWEPRIYLPLQAITALGDHDDLNRPDSPVLCSALGRLREDTSIGQAEAEAAVRGAELLTMLPASMRRWPIFEHATIQIQSGRTGFPTDFYSYEAPLLLLQGLVAVVLLLCCVNVAGLLMSKIYSRQHEFAVRSAIGGSRWRLGRQHITESLLLALAGAVLGGMASGYISASSQVFFRDPNSFESLAIHTDKTVFLITGALAVIVTVLAGTIPALRVGSTDPGSLLHSRNTLGGRLRIVGRMFVPAQVALSLVLIATAGLLSQSLSHLRSSHLGFDASHVTIQTPPFNDLPQKGNAKLDLYQRMTDRIQQLPGVQDAAVTWYTPLSGSQSTGHFRALAGPGTSLPDVQLAFNTVGPGYFRTMKTNLLTGREFTTQERTVDLCVVNESAARTLFPNQLAIGGCVATANTGSREDDEVPKVAGCRVIGVAENAKFANVRDIPPPTIYFPVSDKFLQGNANLVFLINANTKAQAIAAYTKALKEIAPTVPLVLFVTLEEQLDAALGSQRLITLMSRLFAGLALALSALGLYGLLAASVAQRTAEIGLRMALGAGRTTVLCMILKEALGLLLVGAMVGAAFLVIAVRFIHGMIFGVSSYDPAVLLGTLAVLAVVSILAALLPARRAANVDPQEALRAS